MANYDKQTVLAAIERDGVVPVFYHPEHSVVSEVVACLVSAGLTTLEFTNRGDGAIEVFRRFVPVVRERFPQVVVGVGSVVDSGTSSSFLDLGADFVFAPSFSDEVARTCHARNVPYVPGCGSVAEIQSAYRSGVDLVKLFPASAIGGPGFLAAVRSPCPWVKAIPTGGVEPTVASLSAWFDAGAPAVGMGSQLMPTELIRSQDWVALESHISDAVGAVSEARGGAT